MQTSRAVRQTYQMKPFFLIFFSLLTVACQDEADTHVTGGDIHRLAEQGKTTALLNLIEDSASVNQRDVCYRTPLMFAAQFGRLDTVRELLDAGARVDLHEKGYYTALMLAAGNGHTEVVRVLAEAGAAVDEVEITDGWTALVWAAQRGHVETVRLLLDLGADPAHRDRRGRTARDLAVRQRHSDVVALL